MEAGNHELWDRIKPPKATLVTRDLLPDDIGYRIGFTPSNEALKLTSTFEGKKTAMPFPDWAESKSPRKEENLPPVDFVYVSEQGMNLVRSLGYDWFRGDVFNPSSWNGVKIGEGSESIVYKTNLDGKECVIKLTNFEDLKRSRDFSARYRRLMPYYSAPDYERKFGISSKISTLLRQVAAVKPMKTFELDDSPIDYVASKYFIIEEYKEGFSLQKLQDDIKNGKDISYSKHDINFWKNWLLRFSKYKDFLSSLFFAVEAEGGELSGRADFAFSNWIVTGFNDKTRKIKLFLIDQSPANASVDAMDSYIRDGSQFAALKKHKATKAFKRLRRLDKPA